MKKFSIYTLACFSAASRLQVQAYSAYNAHSIYGYQWGTDDSSFVDTSDWDGGNNLSWQSVVECFPDKRYDWSASSPYDTDADNYDNWACNLAFDNNWKDGSMFPCGADESTPVWYFLNDVAGTPLGPDGTGMIGCHLSDESYGQQRNIQFPEGYFILTEQVWVPPLTAITGHGDPNGNPYDETYFIAMVDGDKDGYDDFGSSLTNAESLVNPNDGWGEGYCNPTGDFDYFSWGKDTNGNDDAFTHVKAYRKGFLMHGSTYLANVNILGSDTLRPEENGFLCGGGAIETPGCVSSYGALEDGEWACYAGGLIPGDDNYFIEEYGYWVTGGIADWGKETDAFGGVSWITVDNVRFNDPYARNIDPQDDWRMVPASQTAFLLAGTPNGAYTNNVTLTNLVSLTTVADGINIGGNTAGLDISWTSMQNPGDDAYGFWQNTGDQSLSLTDSHASNPGVRQHNWNDNGDYEPQYGFGSCISFFGCHDAYIENFLCEDRYCDDNPGHCNDKGQGHLITFYPPNWFYGHYDWGDDVCTVTANNMNWTHIDDGTQVNPDDEVFDDDYLGNPDGHRDWISRCDYGGCMDNGEDTWVTWDAKEPWVCWDDNCKTASDWETPRQ